LLARGEAASQIGPGSTTEGSLMVSSSRKPTAGEVLTQPRLIAAMAE